MPASLPSESATHTHNGQQATRTDRRTRARAKHQIRTLYLKELICPAGMCGLKLQSHMQSAATNPKCVCDEHICLQTVWERDP